MWPQFSLVEGIFFGSVHRELLLGTFSRPRIFIRILIVTPNTSSLTFGFFQNSQFGRIFWLYYHNIIRNTVFKKICSLKKYKKTIKKIDEISMGNSYNFLLSKYVFSSYLCFSFYIFYKLTFLLLAYCFAIYWDSLWLRFFKF